jgi:glucose-6-phosphate isomerase
MLIHTPIWFELSQHAQRLQATSLRLLFEHDSQRFQRFSVQAPEIFADFSKNLIDPEVWPVLMQLARQQGVEAKRDAMFRGESINSTEKRPVLHTALRCPKTQTSHPEVHQVLERMKIFCDQVRSGEWRGYDGQPITDIVNIGIGGSDLGPQMVCTALHLFGHSRLQLHFVSNVDGHDLSEVLSKVRPGSTLFIVASKTFTTEETLANARSARAWFLASGASQIEKHFVAVSTNEQEVRAFGIDPDRMFPFWDWVGGRYSLWSAIGLSIMLQIGPKQFDEFLAGAHDMDQHFATAPLETNLPVIMGLLEVWGRNFLGYHSRSIAPYHHALRFFPSYLQQLDMESNGKRVARDGTVLPYQTGAVVWGQTGTNGQHAYFQLLHQGSDIIPVDFIACVQPRHNLLEQHEKLLANCMAQSQALAFGKTAEEVAHDMNAAGISREDVETLLPHRTFPGNRPSTVLLLSALTPRSLGALIALYEHKVMVCGAIWDINSFDQWGVELGKVLARRVQQMMQGEAIAMDASTQGLWNTIQTLKNKTS